MKSTALTNFYQSDMLACTQHILVSSSSKMNLDYRTPIWIEISIKLPPFFSFISYPFLPTSLLQDSLQIPSTILLSGLLVPKTMSFIPETNDPFPGAGDQSICEKEDLALGRSPNIRTCESAATQPPGIEHKVQNNNVSSNIMSVTQTLMQSACKRRKLSSSGTKAQLANRLSGVGVVTKNEVRKLAEEFELQGPDETVASNGKQKSPNWTKHESVTLCHVIADPRHATVVDRLYNKFNNKAELDAGKHDPWSAEFVDLFNDLTFQPTVPDGQNGITDDLLLSFDPCLHPHKRNGTFLKQRWNKLRSKYTVAREKFTRSGQGENDNFDLFTDGDDSLSYMHCVFYGLPSLEAIVRTLPEGVGIEVGIDEVHEARESSKTETKGTGKKGTIDHVLSKGLIGIANSMSAPVNITVSDGGKQDGFGGKFLEFDVSDRVASTVEKLMSLESNILIKLKQAQDENDREFESVLEARINLIRQRIDKALFTE